MQPELAAALSASIPALTAQHVREVRQIPSAAALDEDAARDDLPDVLEALAQALRQPGNAEHLALCGPAHASARDGQRFTLEELMAEYVLVRQSLHTHVRARMQRDLTTSESIMLHAAMDGVVATTVASFAAQREARLKLECTALSDFLNSLAHALRNEINGVMTSLDLVQETGADLLRDSGASAQTALAATLQEFLRDLAIAREAMESSVQAMTRLMEVERARTRVKLKVRAVAILPLLQGVVRSASRGLREKGGSSAGQARQAIGITCPADLILSTDPDLLGTVLVNLVGNAVKHASDGGIHISAGVQSGGVCRIEVRDSGPGIAPERIPHLFERFERGEGRTAGAGLGPFVARRAARLLGSAIDVTSELGRGSCFALALPPHGPGPHDPVPATSMGKGDEAGTASTARHPQRRT